MGGYGGFRFSNRKEIFRNSFFLRFTLGLLFAVFLLGGNVAAQTLMTRTVEGTITDPFGMPLPGVEVALVPATSEEDGLKVRSDASGRYRFTDAPKGVYTLRAISDDFEPVTVRIEITQPGVLEQDLQFVSVRRSKTTIEVVGESPDVLQQIPGSVALISSRELAASHPVDANEVLRRVPGVIVREDSGPVGMRLNIGIRGLNPDRSRKVLMLEDGIPIALAPYGEPEMYYSPPIDRMRRVEILKGSGQIMHGPQTVGGVVNFVTPDPPSSTHGTLDIKGGQRGFFAAQGSIGGSNEKQTTGWFVNFLRKQGDGFRDFFFDINDVQSKFTFQGTENHSFAVKLGVYDEVSNSTYLGLTSPMFSLNPDQNAVPNDHLKVRRYSGSLSHTAVLNPKTVLMTTFFAYSTVRNWRRQDWDRTDKGREYLAVIGDAGVPGGAIYLRDSTGNRNREFRVLGIQSNLTREHEFGGLRGKLDMGVRYIGETADDMRINGDRFDAETGILRSDEERTGEAFSFFIQNRFFLGEKLSITPGLRLENYRYERHIFRQPVGGVPTDVDVRNRSELTRPVPGLGISYHLNSQLTFFGGVHRGFAPPRTKDAITRDGEALDLDAELSWNYEAGVRIGPGRALTGEVTFFRLDFQNQIIPAALSGGATTTLTNGGQTLHEGVEAAVRVDWKRWLKAPGFLFTEFRAMHLSRAEFTGNSLYEGNRLPYAPRNTFSVLFGYRQPNGIGFQVDSSYIGDQFGDNLNTFIPSPDGTVGALPGFTVWNMGLDYTLRRERVQLQPYVTVKNLTNRVYISSRAPQGIQPGMFRQALLGLRFSF